MSNRISRREFLKKSAIGIAIGGTAFSSLNLESFTKSSTSTSVIISGDDLLIKLSENPSLSKPGGSLRVNDEIMLIRKSETEFIAVKTICTHKGCDVELEGNKFVCPCHGSEYTIEGKLTEGPAKKDLTTYPVEFNSGEGVITIKLKNNQ